MATKVFKLTPEQMALLWQGCERSGTLAGEPEWRQREEEEKLMKETEKCRTRLFWLLVEVQELKNKLTRSL
tara:strand:+ start:324 stop:536 length:213 start_codon:yes stop_codon:yes gene_type:complete